MELFTRILDMLSVLYCSYVSVVGVIEYLLRCHIQYPIFSVFHLLTHYWIYSVGYKRGLSFFVCEVINLIYMDRK